MRIFLGRIVFIQFTNRIWPICPNVPDNGINNVILDLVNTRPEFKEYIGWREPFRKNGPLEKVLRER